MNRRKTLLAAITMLGSRAVSAWAISSGQNIHITDGIFEPNEWNVDPTTDSTAFGLDATTNRGGAVLYVEQSTNGQGGVKGFGTTLDLMYDYVSSPTVLGPTSNATNSSLDVFFQVPNDGDYAIHITGAGFTAFEKQNGAVSAENPDGTLKFSTPTGTPIAPWTAFDSTDPDFAGADLQAVLGFGPSPNSAAPHLIAEFQLSIDSQGSGGAAGGGNPGLYDPAPAFWSASGKSGTIDPPISSEIFNLQPDGTTIAFPVVNSNGDPVSQPSDLPEPASAMLLAAGLSTTLLRRRRRI
jgi:hypothetical protein